MWSNVKLGVQNWCGSCADGGRLRLLLPHRGRLQSFERVQQRPGERDRAAAPRGRGGRPEHDHRALMSSRSSVGPAPAHTNCGPPRDDEQRWPRIGTDAPVALCEIGCVLSAARSLLGSRSQSRFKFSRVKFEMRTRMRTRMKSNETRCEPMPLRTPMRMRIRMRTQTKTSSTGSFRSLDRSADRCKKAQ